MKTTEINNSQEVIDSRDVIKRIEELEDLISNNKELPKKKREDLTEEERELKVLNDLAEESNGSPDWECGETLIRESFFTEYVEEMLVDIGDLPKEIPHYIVIDWEATAENIKTDYTTVDFDGIDYLIRG